MNVKNAVQNFEIPYPVVLDNNDEMWKLYNNHYWPAHYLYDAIEQLRYTHFGEGDYEKTEQAIRKLLREKGEEIKEEILPVKIMADFSKTGSPETYLGYARMVGF
ncbi:MAG: hypothetical protein MZU84_03505 [Sphingobacterium sp.]|nr:hypothetical protein [Sphingobacterium sp.]